MCKMWVIIVMECMKKDAWQNDEVEEVSNEKKWIWTNFIAKMRTERHRTGTSCRSICQ